MATKPLSDDTAVIARVLDHIDNSTTDLGDATWREPVANYLCHDRLQAELRVLRGYPIPFCPSAALGEPGSYLARQAAGTPLLAVRGSDSVARVFRNACRHRGTQLADGTGCKKAFACPYHGWTYGLDGALRHLPHEHGFPELDKSTRGLVPVASAEHHGMVFVTQEGAKRDPSLDAAPTIIADGYRLIGFTDGEIAANWKLLAEGFLEGYHIRATHSSTFYPLQFDNLNVIETFGRHRRIVFPYQSVNKLRDVPHSDWYVDGTLTYVYHLFPNVTVATFPGRIIMTVLEPVATDRTRQIMYALSNRDPNDLAAQEKLARNRDLVAAGAAEDQEVACAIQRGLRSGANEYFEFGRFEGAIGHFHRALGDALDDVA